MPVRRNYKRPPIIIAFAILFAAVVFVYPQHLAPSFAGYDHVVKLTSNRDAYDFVDCVVEQNERNPETSLQYLSLGAYNRTRGDIVLRSRDKRTLININSGIVKAEDISIIARVKSMGDGQIIEGIKECAEDSET